MAVRAPLLSLAPIAAAVAGYELVVRGALTLDLRVGRAVRPLGPIAVAIAAPPETVFDIVAAPYLGRTPRAMQARLQVLERGSDMVLAAHDTTVGRRTTTTVETVRFERPERVAFRLVRGPVPYVVETFELRPTPEGTRLEYGGEIGADLWRLGRWWADKVAARWERAVAASLEGIRLEAERRAGSRRRHRRLDRRGRPTRSVRSVVCGAPPGRGRETPAGEAVERETSRSSTRRLTSCRAPCPRPPFPTSAVVSSPD